ncbi:hypothetical protein Tco_0957209 [Tanacetum coccineum]
MDLMGSLSMILGRGFPSLTYSVLREFVSSTKVNIFCNSTMEVWILKKKEWVLQYRMDDLPSRYYYAKSHATSGDRFYVYHLKSRKLHEADVLGRGNEGERIGSIVDHRKALIRPSK